VEDPASVAVHTAVAQGFCNFEAFAILRSHGDSRALQQVFKQACRSTVLNAFCLQLLAMIGGTLSGKDAPDHHQQLQPGHAAQPLVELL
jgi:hypothetical protein